MKWYKPLLILCVVASGTIRSDDDSSCDFESTSKSYMNFPPPFQAGTPEMIAGFRHNGFEADRCLGFQFAFFGGRSTKNSHLARYFSPFGTDMSETPLRFGTDPARPNGDFDVLADHFGVLTTNAVTGGTADQFLSNVTMDPQQSFVGIGFQFRYNFWQNWDRERGWWISISTPLEHIKNDMNFVEDIIQPGGAVVTPGEVLINPTPPPLTFTIPNQVFFGSLETAFMQDAWQYGKIKTDGSLKKTRLADIDFRIGYEWLQLTPYHLESFVGIIIPTGNRPDAEFLFEPIVGNGKHVALEWGATYEMDIWDNECREMYISLELSAVGKYLFKKKQIRSLDLKYKPWSRYIQLYRTEAEAQTAATSGDPFGFTPGINVLTREVDVTPGYQAYMNTAFILEWRYFNFEVGHNLLARRSECVELSESWTEKAAIKAFIGQGFTSPIRDITGNGYTETASQTNPPFILPAPLANYPQSIIKESDLDLSSAATPAMLAHTFYGNFEYVFDICDWPLFIDFGASYTFAHSNNVVQKWMLWGKFGIAF